MKINQIRLHYPKSQPHERTNEDKNTEQTQSIHLGCTWKQTEGTNAP